MGLRDYAILQLLSTYGLRDGEIRRCGSTISTGAPRPCVSIIPKPACTRCCR